VQVNGHLLRTSAAPIKVSGRTLVPMRDIFQALGASVNWNRLTREITAQHGASDVRLQIGRRQAMVDGREIVLDQAPVLHEGATMVPLRFVAEGLGAEVHWNEALNQASVSTAGSAGQPAQTSTGGRTIVIPADTVVPVRLNSPISSADARVGDSFTATVVSEQRGDSEFPPGSILEGHVRGVHRHRGGSPGVLDVVFRAVETPDGTRYTIHGELIALDDDTVRTNARGRLMARRDVGNAPFQFVGVGPGGGHMLGRVTWRNGAVANVRRATGAFLYRQNRRSRTGDAIVPRSATFGVRMTESVSYGDTVNYAIDRQGFLDENANRR
jgi:hypothetical protein